MLRVSLLFALQVSLGVAVIPVQAADFSDPDWPCIQRKVPRMSIGQMWNGSIVEDPSAWQQDAVIKRLAPLLAARRTSLDEAEVLISDFAGSETAGEQERLALLFQATFDLIDRQRAEIIDGIGRYARTQAELATLIEADRSELSTIKAEEEPDFDRIEELEDKLAWDTRIYNDRAQSLTYVCETPVLLEQRAFAIARAIAKHGP